jgi:hypothetical protein
MLFLLWAAIVIAILFASGYSHYRYRVKNNQYYARVFTQSGSAKNPALAQALPAYNRYAFPLLALMIVCLLVPISLAI